MHPVILIPARRASTRLPDKPLAEIAGLPMIAHVCQRALESCAGPVWVATDCREIAEAAEKAGAHSVMTRADHPSGSDRIYEALERIDPQNKFNVVVNLQGDLPTLDPVLIQQVISPLHEEAVAIGTLVCEITEEEDRYNPAVVKPVIAWSDSQRRKGRALYFSRASVPTGHGALYHHIGIYAYRRESLAQFVALPPSPLELQEKLEQLRALEHGMRIDVLRVDTVPLGVDTEEQLQQARRMLS